VEIVDYETLFSGETPALAEIQRRMQLLAQSDAPVWLHGELGTGRLTVARAIHDRSRRAAHMFMAVNAATLPGDTLEEHLFAGDTPHVTSAHGGTLFIDSIVELAPGVQVKLLRLLEERRLRLRGIDHEVDVRVIVGDERRTMNVGGRMRRDLYYQLRVHELDLPALRDRPRDLGAIVARVLDKLRAHGIGRATTLSPEAMRALERYSFPGNVRELADALTHAMIFAQGATIDVEHLPVDIQRQAATVLAGDPESLEALDLVARRFEHDYLLRVLRAVDGNRTRAAKILGLSRKGLWQKLKSHAIASDAGRPDDEDL
jgi:DNA-binding NtrC family response regulator